MSEIRKCKDCGEVRYQQGAGSHVETGRLACERLTARQASIGTLYVNGPRAVACPYCHAGEGDHCRTNAGRLTGRYGERVNHYRREVAWRRELASRSAS